MSCFGCEKTTNSYDDGYNAYSHQNSRRTQQPISNGYRRISSLDEQAPAKKGCLTENKRAVAKKVMIAFALTLGALAVLGAGAYALEKFVGFHHIGECLKQTWHKAVTWLSSSAGKDALLYIGVPMAGIAIAAVGTTVGVMKHMHEAKMKKEKEDFWF